MPGAEVLARAVHRRPDAVRPGGRQRVRAQQGGLRLPPRAGVRAGAAGRRDQPRRPEDAKRAARGDGRAAGVGRERDPRAAPAVLRHRHAEPDRPAGHLPAARIAARPLLAAHHAGLPGPGLRTRAADRRRPARGHHPHGSGDGARRTRAGSSSGARGAGFGSAARLSADADRRHALGPVVRRRPESARRHRRAARGQGTRADGAARLCRARRHPGHPAAGHRAPLEPIPGAGRGAIEQVRAMVEATAIP